MDLKVVSFEFLFHFSRLVAMLFGWQRRKTQDDARRGAGISHAGLTYPAVSSIMSAATAPSAGDVEQLNN